MNRFVLFLAAAWITASQTTSAQEICWPVFTVIPPDTSVDCSEALPSFGAFSASSDCCGPTAITTLTSETGNVRETCSLSTAFGPGPDWAIWLPDIDPQHVSWAFTEGGTLEEYGDGTAHVWGTIHNTYDPTMGFVVHLWMHNGRNWAEWSALGRGYKDDLNLAGNNYLDWTYYELVPGFAYLDGIGSLAGSHLQLSHLPVNHYFGFQSGVAANNKNANDGISGWFTYTGWLNGEWVSGHGDLNADRACSQPPQGCASTSYTQVARAYNECGLSAYASQTISTTDAEAPTVIEFQDTLFLACEIPTDQVFLTAVDNCSSLLITYSDAITGSGCAATIERTYSVADACGNAVTVVQWILFNSGESPAFTGFPTDTEAACSNLPPIQNDLITWTDGCSNTVLSWDETILPGNCSGSYTLVRTYTLTDDCGNSVSQDWTIQVFDLTPPVLFNVPEDITLNCGDPVPDALVFGIDNCTPSPAVGLSAQTIPLECGYLFVRTWFVADDCGNMAEASQTITVLDDQPPVFTFVPADEAIDCASVPGSSSAVAEDACSAVSVTFSDEWIGSGCEQQIVRTFTATDGCGNQATATQHFYLVDTTAPALVASPETATAPCGNVPEIDLGAFLFTDECSAVELTYTSSNNGGACPGSGVIVFTVTATDACGNSSQTNWSVIITDTDPPLFTDIPDDLVLECGDPTPVTSINAFDACSETITLESEDFVTPTDCGEILQRTWTATDGCGNSNSYTQTIVFEDTTDPYFLSFPEDITIQCGDAIPDVILPPATDACVGDVPTILATEVLPGSCPGESTILRIFRAFDNCGNQAMYVQSVFIVDTTAPGISGEAFLEISCDEVSEAWASANDGCGEVDLSWTDSGNAECGNIIERLYTAVDACGNTSTFAQSLLLSDTEAPVLLGVPADETIDCGEEIQEAIVTASDNCTAVPSIGVSANTTETECGYIFTRTWFALDDCGNMSEATQVITATDLSAPVLSDYPSDVSLACGDPLPNLPFITATDNCAGEVDVDYQEITIPGKNCDDVIQRTWCASDCAGNLTCHTQTITYSPLPGITFALVGQSDEAVLLKIENTPGGRLELDLYAADGSFVRREMGSDVAAGRTVAHVLDTSGLAAGIYLIRLRSGADIRTQRIVVSR